MLFAGAVVTFFGLVPAPREIGLPDPDSDEATTAASAVDNEDEENQERSTKNF